jgi:hypothetical protein
MRHVFPRCASSEEARYELVRIGGFRALTERDSRISSMCLVVKLGSPSESRGDSNINQSEKSRAPDPHP